MRSPHFRLLLAVLLAAPLSACLSDNSPVVITGFHPLLPDPQKGCAVNTDATVQLSYGQLDSTKATSYIAGISFANNTLDNSDTKTHTSSNYAVVDALHLTYTTTGGQPAPAAETIPMTAVVPAAGSLFGPAEVITSQNGQVLASWTQDATLLVHVTATGHFEGGGTWTTAEDTLPIDVCSGCLSICSDDKATATCGKEAAGQPDGRVCPVGS